MREGGRRRWDVRKSWQAEGDRVGANWTHRGRAQGSRRTRWTHWAHTHTHIHTHAYGTFPQSNYEWQCHCARALCPLWIYCTFIHSRLYSFLIMFSLSPYWHRHRGSCVSNRLCHTHTVDMTAGDTAASMKTSSNVINVCRPQSRAYANTSSHPSQSLPNNNTHTHTHIPKKVCHYGKVCQVGLCQPTQASLAQGLARAGEDIGKGNEHNNNYWDRLALLRAG